MTADGAYDGEAVYDAVAERHPNATVIIPPRATSVAGETTATQRDQHLAMIDEQGRMGWQRRSGYNQRSLVEPATFRYKTIIGRRVQARTLSNQKTEAKIGCNVLNRMERLGMPASARVHCYASRARRRNQRLIHAPTRQRRLRQRTELGRRCGGCFGGRRCRCRRELRFAKLHIGGAPADPIRQATWHRRRTSPSSTRQSVGASAVAGRSHPRGAAPCPSATTPQKRQSRRQHPNVIWILQSAGVDKLVHWR